MRHRLLLLVSLAVMVAASAFTLVSSDAFPLLDWADKAKPGKRSVAVLLELGHKDDEPTDWSGKAQFHGAEVVHREGYRFRDGDRLIGNDAWSAHSRRGIRVPKDSPAIVKTEPVSG